MNKARGRRKVGFAPVVDAGVETLILGSFPSVASLAQAQYYGHPQNQFWRLVGTVVGEPLHELAYAQRLETLLRYRIGLWDIIGTCRRQGSLDSAIRMPRHNDFARVTRVARQLRRIFFNGKTAGRMESLFRGMGCATVILPSSSPAYTLSFEEKLKQWRRIRDVEVHELQQEKGVDGGKRSVANRDKAIAVS